MLNGDFNQVYLIHWLSVLIPRQDQFTLWVISPQWPTVWTLVIKKCTYIKMQEQSLQGWPAVAQRHQENSSDTIKIQAEGSSVSSLASKGMRLVCTWLRVKAGTLVSTKVSQVTRVRSPHLDIVFVTEATLGGRLARGAFDSSIIVTVVKTQMTVFTTLLQESRQMDRSWWPSIVKLMP